MTGRKLRALAAGAGLAVLALGLAPGAQAQWFPPLGAAPPGEIMERLRAQGFRPVGPLVRRDTIYLADVKGPRGRERLVIDAWSGAILQSFVARGRDWRPGAPDGYVARGGEFDYPPPLAPPNRGDFLDPHNGWAYGAPDGDYPVIVGPGGVREPPRPHKPHKPAEPKPPATAALPAAPAPPRTPAAAPAPAVPPASTAVAPTPAAPTPAPAAAASPAPAPAPPAAAPASVTASQAPAPKPAAPAPAPSGKKINDVPVNPLE